MLKIAEKKNSFIVSMLLILIIGFGPNLQGTSINENPISTMSKNTTNTLTTGSGTIGFISKWNTNNPGMTNSTTIALPLVSTGIYDFNVSWGDGNNNTITTYNQPEVIHTYSSPGTYTVNIVGTIGGWQFNNGGDVLKIIEISHWGNLTLGTSSAQGYYFAGASNLVLTATDAPNLNGTTSLAYAFSSCTNLGSSGSMNSWNVSQITSMAGMFEGASNFNQTLNSWNVSKVIDMSYMFNSASIFNQSMNNWDVSNVTTMSYMFYGASSFNQNISSWNVSHVTDMSYMFEALFTTSVFNQNISNWNVSHVTTMIGMFWGATAFNQSLSNWNVSQVTNMAFMFYGASSFNQSLSSWDVSNVTNMKNMFGSASSFNQNISNWDVSHVTNMIDMFAFASAFNQPLGNWNVSQVTSMNGMFISDAAFNQNISNWDVSHVTDMTGMFNSASAFNQSLNNWDVSNVTNMQYMFSWDTNFNQPLDNWQVSKVTNMYYMFYDASAFNQPLNNWDVSHVTTMSYMFKGAVSFNQPLDSWNVSQVTDMSYMFEGDSAFNQPLGTWNVSKVTTMYYMFYGDNLSIANYDNLLIGWASLPLQSNVQLYAGHSMYDYKADSSHYYLTNHFNWIINDGITFGVPTISQNLQPSVGNGYVYVTWSAPISNGFSSLTNYTIYRSTTSGSSYVLVGTVSASTLSFNDTSVTNGLTYYYVVKANNYLGASVNSAEVSATPMSTPSAPQSLQTSSGNGFVYLTWSAPTSTGGSTLTNYTIFRSTTSGSGYVLIKTVSASTLSFNDTSVTNGKTYYYVVRANNAAVASSNSNQVSGKPNAPVQSPTSTSTNSTTSTKITTNSPGFELFTVVLLLVSLTILNRKRKN